MAKKPRYYLKADFQEEWQEVTIEKYCRAERVAGFRPSCSSQDPNFDTTPATSGFGGSGVQGRISY